ncbi:CLUMA_CG008100, isoform A [Clunio marinus]|uniref:CLUMA_CG008100, isoform A n=1 Tax=Clunio marinus TaxID=568069 RepID=A0A1J1I2R3_9DIPT|nr:CLUMA_CG008100, isoform A [Clunio marinus]
MFSNDVWVLVDIKYSNFYSDNLCKKDFKYQTKSFHHRQAETLIFKASPSPNPEPLRWLVFCAAICNENTNTRKMRPEMFLCYASPLLSQTKTYDKKDLIDLDNFE